MKTVLAQLFPLQKITLLIFAFALVSFYFSSSTWGQENKNAREKASGETNVLFPIKKYKPFFNNKKVKVKNLSFVRQSSEGDLGETLDVIFELRNRTVYPIDVYCFVSTYDERDSVSENFKKQIRHADWRKKVLNNADIIVLDISTAPQNIDPAKIWRKKDPDYIFYSKLLNQKQAAVSVRNLISEVYPPIWKYLEYMRANPKEGLRLTLHGQKTPSNKNAIQISNKGKRSESNEQGKRIEFKKNNPTYLLVHEAGKTYFRSRHFLPYKEDRSTFNRIAIFLLEASVIDNPTPENQGKGVLFKGIYQVQVPYVKN